MGKFRIDKLCAQWAEILQIREKQADGGKKGNQFRWGGGSVYRSVEGGTAFAFADAEKDLNLGKPQKPLLVPVPPDSNSEKQNPPSNGKPESQKQKLEDQQKAYGEVGKLITGAVGIVLRAKKAGKSWFSADCKEELKIWAQDHDVPFDTDRISKALEIAEQRVRENEQKNATQKSKAHGAG